MHTLKTNNLNSGRKATHSAFVFWFGGLLTLTLVCSSCSRDANGKARIDDPRKKMTVPVTVSSVEEKTVPLQLRAIGNVKAFATVTVKAQVSGELVSVHFQDGQYVKKGDLLFTIDPRPFQVKLSQAKAMLAKDKAQLENALKQVERNASVVNKGYVSKEQYDQVVANAAALKAGVQADEAAVENAELEVKYCSIRSPLDGIVGEVKVDRGNLIKATDNDNPMVRINQISPIYVSFFLPEKHLTAIKKHMASGSLEVETLIPGDEAQPIRGKLTFLDNAVDPSTGTIQLKATVPNEDWRLWPGQFVNTVLTLASQPNTLVVPSQAVQTGQEGSYVFVVKPDNTVEYRHVTVGRNLDNDVTIEKGVAAGEKVVIDGQLSLAPGSQVKIVENLPSSSKGQES